jgi:tRNA(fMet)-specific endonuclease VapC
LLYGIECDKTNFKENREKVDDLIELLTVIPIKDTLQEYAKQKAQLRKQGKLIDDLDIFIGATAIANDMILVTDNEKHLDRLSNIKIENKKAQGRFSLRFFIFIKFYFIKSTRPFTSVNTALAIEEETSS